MIANDIRTYGVLSLMGLVSTACGDPESRSFEPIARVGQGLVRTVGGFHQNDIEAAIAVAQPGDTIVFPAGTYEIIHAFRFKSEVAFRAADNAEVVLDASWLSTVLALEHAGEFAIKNTTIEGLQFRNLRLNFDPNTSTYGNCSNIYLKNLTFSDGKRTVTPATTDTDWSEYGYIRVGRCDGVVIDGCTLLRSGEEQGGQGIKYYRPRSPIIKDSFIGTDKHLVDGAPQGYFRTAVNVYGEATSSQKNREIKIHNTIVRRVHNPVCACEGEPGLKPGDPPRDESCCEDHGIYAAHYDGFEGTKNRIDGWSSSSSGGAFKLRNADNTFVFGNRMMRSGILTYTDGDALPDHFKQVHVRGNRIDMRTSAEPCEGYCGILYALKDDGDREIIDEEDIFLAGNTFADGGTVRIAAGHGPAFCVEDNPGATNDFEAAGVLTSGCAPSSEWDRPLAGVFTGDFNADEKNDIATRVRENGTGVNWRWRVYVSDGDHYRMQDWGDGTYLDGDTELYGVHVGDFTEDGRDDIIYRGRCGDGNICWRVHKSTGSTFETRYGFGDGTYESDETFRFGVHVGDFDGDGFKDDLVYRGKCGSPARACWRVHKSDGDSFSTVDFGDSAVWYPDDSETYGLLIGNFDGDAAGKDDIAYVGKCGTARCLRVHLSTGSAFVYQSAWAGTSLNLDGPHVTEHFGLRVGDRPTKDGRADIGYRSVCGTTKGWRYHVSTGTGFVKTTTCSSTYDF